VKEPSLAATSKERPPIIINGDDLGRTVDVNAAIMDGIAKGFVSDASILVNMPAFAEASELIREARLQNQVGLHLNLTQGRPLTMPIREQPALCEPSGDFWPRARSFWRLSASESRAIAIELEAQMEALLAEGITPSHLDSHHHMHNQWPIGSIVIRLARRFDVPAIRISRNCGRFSSRLRKGYRQLYNVRLSRSGLAGTTYFGSAADILALGVLSGPAEVMVHPERDAAGVVVDCVAGAGRLDSAVPLEPIVAQLKAMGRITNYRAIVLERS
jgi:predicted glycoside hydrolase/deacetylase ChbG (UPF0249 family)